MKNKLQRLLVWMWVICLGAAPTVAAAAQKTDSSTLKSSQAFAFKLYQGLYQAEEDNGNMVLSPLSVGLSASMVANGAKGSTRSGMIKALQFSSLDKLNKGNAQLIDLFEGTSKGADVRLSNGLFIGKDIRTLTSFTNANRKYYDAKIQNLDFQDARQSAKTVNDWVEQNTQGHISEIVQEDALEDAVLLSVNTVYFNGQWMYPFDPAKTQTDSFTTLKGKTTSVDMMGIAPRHFDTLEKSAYQAVRLPYGDGRLSMILFLPAQGTEKKFLENFSADELLTFREEATMQRLSVRLPKFEHTFSASLADTLSDLGMSRAFTPGKADFSYMVKSKGNKLYISDVLHSVYIRVDEKGTEAAAASSTAISTTSLELDAMELVLDRPFAYVIEDTQTGAPLFVGAVGDPTE